MKTKVTYIISDINKALAFEWIAEYLDGKRFELKFMLLNPGPSALEQYLLDKNIPVTTITCRSKKDWPGAWRGIYRQLKQDKPHVVHCHLQQACILGLTAAKLAGIKARIHTRHHSSLHHTYHPKGIIWDKMINRFSTAIIAISNPVREILTEWEHVNAAKVIVIPHGFLLDKFSSPDQAQLNLLRQKYGLQSAQPVIGVISRFTEWKGVQYIIPAFRQLREKFPAARLLLFNASGDYSAEINRVLTQLEPGSFETIAFEENIATAYQLFDICVHVPIDKYSEAFGQVYIEALASGVPLVATFSGIANDALMHKQNAWVVPYRNSDAIVEGLVQLLENVNLRQSLVDNGRKTAQDFSLDKMITKLERLYESA